MLDSHQRGIIAILAAGALWSTAGLFIKLIDLAPLAITAWRSAFAGLAFLFIFRSNCFVFDLKMLRSSLFYALMLTCFVASNKLTTAANAIFLQFTGPIWILLLEPKIFGARLRSPDIWAVAACLAGMAFFFIDKALAASAPSPFLGNALAIVAGIGMAGFMLSQRLNERRTHQAAIFWGNVLVVAIAVSVGFRSGDWWPDGAEWGRLAFLGIFQIGCAYALFTYGLQRAMAIEASLLSFIEPILSPIWVWLSLGERPSNGAVLGGAIIVAALALRALRLEKQKADAR